MAMTDEFLQYVGKVKADKLTSLADDIKKIKKKFVPIWSIGRSMEPIAHLRQ